MAFPERIRNWWVKVAPTCQYEFYTEKGGFQECGRPVKHVHHINPERDTLLNEGHEADDNVALPTCKIHHVGDDGEEHSRNFSFHPDIGEAYSKYRDWKTNKDRLEVKLEKKLTKEAYPSPFDEATKQHEEMAKEGERYWAGTPEIDKYYEDKMRVKAVVYQAKHPEDKKPHTKRKSIRYKKKGHWVDQVYERDMVTKF